MQTVHLVPHIAPEQINNLSLPYDPGAASSVSTRLFQFRQAAIGVHCSIREIAL